jgi:hypothetical protein
MDAVVLCRVYMSGKSSMVMTVDKQIKQFLGLSPREVIGFRMRTIKGHRLIVGEKLALHSLANPAAHLADVVPAEGE